MDSPSGRSRCVTRDVGRHRAPKTFFHHRNIGGNMKALAELGVIGPNDQVLLPLPLHHAYPLIVGMLTTLTAGSVLVLPASATGPAMMRAARDGGASVIVGVPRLYDAIVNAIDHVSPAGHFSYICLHVLCFSRRLGATDSRPGTRPHALRASARVDCAIAPPVRVRVSAERSTEGGGTRGTVLSGYRLAETASIFTGDQPTASVGRYRLATRRRPRPHRRA